MYSFPSAYKTRNEWAIRIALSRERSWTPGVHSTMSVRWDHLTDNCYKVRFQIGGHLPYTLAAPKRCYPASAV